MNFVDGLEILSEDETKPKAVRDLANDYYTAIMDGGEYNKTEVLFFLKEHTQSSLEGDTRINYIGSHFYGEPEQTINKLKVMLKTFPLRRSYYNSAIQYPPVQSYLGWDLFSVDADKIHGFSGNFENVSFCFSLYTKDLTLINELSEIIKQNIQTFKDSEIKEPTAKEIEILFKEMA